MAETIYLSFFAGLLLSFTCNVYGNEVMFSNTYTVKIRRGDFTLLEKLALKHGFVNETQVVSDYYTFDQRMVPFRSSSPRNDVLDKLLAEPEVLWAEQQVLQAYRLYFSITFNDPRWKDQWYMRRTNLPTYNVQQVWNMGFTGKGIVVAVVDEGLEKNHRELRQNFDPKASFDFIEKDDDPSSSDPIDSVSHGNNCAGVIAAVANNSYCGVGIAYSANISGIRILDNELTDTLKAKGLGFRQDYVDIYSNSWGPEDNGHAVAEIGVMTEKVIRKGAMEGRRGHGSIYVFGAGNGGFSKDSCSFNGLINSIYTIGITGVNKDGSVPRYGERCPGIMAVTYSKEIFTRADKVITASHYGECTDRFSGSSAATAMASGLIALALESNKKLSWRDMQHIIIRSSRADDSILKTVDWITNAANLTASNYVGFGLMDAYRLVSFAKNWTKVPPQLNYTTSSHRKNRAIPSEETLTVNISPNNINFLEHVQVRVTLNFTRRGDLEMDLTSPSGTTSRLIQTRRRDHFTTLTNWTILTLQFWGENASGVWKLTLKNSRPQSKNTGVLFGWSLILYGTETDPIEGNSHIYSPLANTPPTVTSPKEPIPTAIPGCTKLLGVEARSHGYFYRCTSMWKPFLEIRLDRRFKITAVATQQGEEWVKPFKIGFKAGSKWHFVKSEDGTQKVVQQNHQEGSSIVKYQLKQSFVTKVVRIFPYAYGQYGCLRTQKIYGCDPSSDCILVGSLFWGLLFKGNKVSYYYKAYITKLNQTQFVLEAPKRRWNRSYKITDPVLIIDKIPKKEEIVEQARIIASYSNYSPKWYKSGSVRNINTSTEIMQVAFDDKTYRSFSLKKELGKVRLVKRPRIC